MTQEPSDFSLVERPVDLLHHVGIGKYLDRFQQALPLFGRHHDRAGAAVPGDEDLFPPLFGVSQDLEERVLGVRGSHRLHVAIIVAIHDQTQAWLTSVLSRPIGPSRESRQLDSNGRREAALGPTRPVTFASLELPDYAPDPGLNLFPRRAGLLETRRSCGCRSTGRRSP